MASYDIVDYGWKLWVSISVKAQFRHKFKTTPLCCEFKCFLLWELVHLRLAKDSQVFQSPKGGGNARLDGREVLDWLDKCVQPVPYS